MIDNRIRFLQYNRNKIQLSISSV